MKTFANGSKGYELVEKAMSSRNAAWMTKTINGADSAAKQLMIVATARQIANAEVNAEVYFYQPSMISQSIFSDLVAKVDRFGDNAFKLSEKQVAVIVSDLMCAAVAL
ncbi:MAG: hypothetical protein IPM06_20910 [Rhizobiales bacterium]|nr:hypothetical protein [Hyphomicrobiales bacterium]